MATWAFQGQDPFQGISNILMDFYNDGDQGSRAAYDAYLGGLGLTPQSRHAAQSLFGDVNRGYGAYSLGQPDPTSTRFTNWLSTGGGGNILEQINQMNAQERGFRSGNFGGARKMF